MWCRIIFQVFECEEGDEDCLNLLCPQGWRWNKDKDMCIFLEGTVLLMPLKSTGINNGL